MMCGLTCLVAIEGMVNAALCPYLSPAHRCQPGVYGQQAGQKNMFVWLPFANRVLDLARFRRPEWTLPRAAPLTSDLHVGLSVPICRREMETGDREPRRFISPRTSVV